MRRLGFGLGVFLLVVAAASAIAQVLSLFANSGYVPVSLGSIWYAVHANSLVGFQALIEKRVVPEAWIPFQYLLVWPAWLVLGVPGFLMVLACRPRRRAFG